MVHSYLHLLGQVLTATFAARESGDLSAALTKGGLSKDAIAAGEKLASKAEQLIREKIDTIGEDRTHEHAMHAATQELEMWMQTVSFLAKKSIGEEDSLRSLLLAPDLHTHDHAVTSVARALRMMSMMRCDDRVIEAFGGEEKTRNTINRGHALTTKVFRASDIRLSPQGDEHRETIFAKLDATHKELEKWVETAAQAAHAVAEKDLRLVGRFGIVPDGAGLPSGGYSFAVLLHARGQTAAPSPHRADCPGWSVGRQGRNGENLGKGWVTG